MFEHFDTELPHFTGGDRLAYIDVYYDFDWKEIFNHNRAAFPFGKCLAQRVSRECPREKTPALILSAHDDAKAALIETDTHYAVVVNIREYLSSPSFDPSANYFADANRLQLTKATLFKHVMESPDLVSRVVNNSLTIEMIGKWATGASERLAQLKQLVESGQITPDNEDKATETHANLNSVLDILQWIAKTENLGPLLAKLSELSACDLDKITSVVGIASLRSILEIWNSQKQNSSEEFWQDVFTSNPWVISQVFSYPVVIMSKKAYVGGKSIDNAGANIVDILYQNKITTNVVLVEIKNPTTALLSSKYRNVFSVSAELSGSMNQLLNYRQELEKNYHALLAGSNSHYDVINPKCLLIIGSFENAHLDETQKKSFEIFRSDLKSVEIITYDELFAKIQLLLGLLEKNEPSSQST